MKERLKEWLKENGALFAMLLIWTILAIAVYNTFDAVLSR
jgi:predicted negative regulator of RcsB-dependent stress response